MSAPAHDSNPPQGHFGVWQRLLRGYGPLAIFALLILLLSVLVPSKVQGEDVDSDGASATTPSTAADGSPIVVAPGETPTDGATATGGGGTGSAAVAPKLACPDRQDQVPGDPYSPPCVSFSGKNGGDS
jgi:hypothetical protein